MSKRGSIQISPELLFELLGLKDARLLDIRINHFGSDFIEMVIEHPGIMECPEGGIPWPASVEELRS